MPWHSIRDALKLTGKSRSKLYRDMSAGRLSYRSEPDGGRSIETSELIRVYGELRQPETEKRNSRGQGNETTNQVVSELIFEIRALREEVAALKSEIQDVKRIEFKPEKRSWWARFIKGKD